MKKNLVYIVFCTATFLFTWKTWSNTIDVDLDNRIVIDADYLSDWYDEESTQLNTEFRRVQSALKIASNDWSFKTKLALEIDSEDLESTEVEIDDLYIKYSGWKFANITLGKHKEPFGLEAFTSSTQLAIIERAMVSQAFSPKRNTGVSVHGTFNHINWWLGTYNNETYTNDSFDALGSAVTGKITYHSTIGMTGEFHIGSSFSYRNVEDLDYDSRSSLEIHTGSNVLNTKKTNLDNINLLGLEAMWVNNNIYISSEWIKQELHLADSVTQVDHTGYYLQGNYLFGDSLYKAKAGKLASPQLEKSSNLWEFTSRFSYLDTLQSEKGLEVENWTLGINYYHGKKLKLMFDYISSNSDPSSSIEQQNGSAISLRTQYKF